MAHWVQGDTVVDYITLVDAADNPATGASWSTVDTFDPDGVDFSLAISEVGGGVYKVQFTAVKAGHYYWSITTTNLVQDQTYEAEFTVETSPTSTTGVVTAQVAAGTSLLDLFRMLATRLGDFLEIFATTNGAADGSSFVDSLRLATIPSQGLAGANLTFISPSLSANYLKESRVVESDEDTKTLTLTPNLPAQIVTGDTAWLTNLHSAGYYKNQIVNAINSAILKSWPNHMVPLVYTHSSVWDADIPWISLPSSVRSISSVQVYMTNEEKDAFAVPMSFHNRSDLPGWYWDFGNKRLVINNPYRGNVSGFNIRVHGYGRPSTLVNLTDVTTVDAEWVVDMAYEEMKLAKGDQRELAAASMGRNIADMNRGKMTVIPIPGTLVIG